MIESVGMESKAEKAVVTNWVVGPTEDVVQALMEKLVYPHLSRTSMASSPKPPSYDEQKAVARQMHAVVLLYNYYHRKQKPDLKFLDLASFCYLVVVLKPSLAAFINVTRDNKLWELNGAAYQFSLTEKAIKNACDIAVALDVSVEVPNTEGWPISKVAVLLIDSKKENCKLQFGAVTEGVWSLFEKELDGFPISLEQSSGGRSGDKRKRDNLKALMAGNEILQICYNFVREITGTESNELVILGSDVAYSLNEAKSATQFYLVQLPGSGTISPKEQVPLKCLVEKFEGPLAEKAFGTWSTTEVVSYYHMLPYAGFISCWLSGKDLCSPSIHGSFAQSTLMSCSRDTQGRISNSSVSTNTVKDSEHTDSDSSRKTTKSSDETANKNDTNAYHQKSKFSIDREGSVAVNIDKNANQKQDIAKKNSSRRSYFEKLVKDMNERENGKNLVKDDDIVRKRSTKPRVFPVSSTKEAVNNYQHKVFESKGCSPKNVAADIGEMQKLRNKSEVITVSVPENEGRRIDSPKILDKKETEVCQKEGSVFCPSPNREGPQRVIELCETSPPNSGQVTTTTEKLSSRVGSYYHRSQHNISSSTQIDNNHVELVDNLNNSKNTGCRDGKVSGEHEVAISSDQIRNAFAANTKKPADHDKLCQITGTAKLSSVVALENELASSEELQNALALLCIKREQLDVYLRDITCLSMQFSQVCCKDTLAQYENCIERIWDGGEVGLARRCIQSIMNGNNHWMLVNETKMQDRDHNSKSQTENQSSSWLSGIFVPGKSKCQDMENMCPKNNGRRPRYLVEQSEDTVDSFVKLIEDKKNKALTYNELCAKMGKKQNTSPLKALVAVPTVEVGEASEASLNFTERTTNMTLAESGGEALKIILGQGAHLHLDSSAIRGGDFLLDDEVRQMGTVEASAYALPLVVKLLNALISINQNAITSEENESLKSVYQDVLKENENLKASLYEEKTKSEALKQQLEGMKGQLEETKGQLGTERVTLKMLLAEVEKIEARAIAQTRRDLMMEVINGENANWVPVEQVKTCDEMLWRLDNGDGLEGGDDHKRMVED